MMCNSVYLQYSDEVLLSRYQEIQDDAGSSKEVNCAIGTGREK